MSRNDGPHGEDPWGARDEQDDRANPYGLWIWLILIAGVGALVWWLASSASYHSADSTDWPQIVKLLAILAFVSSGLIFVRRIKVGEALRNAAIWVAIGSGILVAYSYRDVFEDVANRVKGDLLPHEAVEVSEGVLRITAGQDGHFHLVADVNGTPVRFLIDTGASDIVLSRSDAERAGYRPGDLSFTQAYQTANGLGFGAPIRLDTIAVGPIRFHDFPASVNDAELSSSLLGISFLERLDSYEVRRDVMLLRQ